jgi:hypothetical protein
MWATRSIAHVWLSAASLRRWTYVASRSQRTRRLTRWRGDRLFDQIHQRERAGLQEG